MEYIFGASGQSAIGSRKLRVRIGPSIESLAVVNPNLETDPHFIDSPYFVGHIVVRIKNFRGIPPEGDEIVQADEYFGTRKRLFALQVCGRFKHEYCADDVVFGTEFERKVSPPTGSWIALKFANLIDPALQADMYGEKPWMFSPILCSMNVVNVTKAQIAAPGAAPIDPSSKASDKASVSSKASKASMMLLSGPDPAYKRDPSKEVSKRSSKIKTTPTPSEILGQWLWSGTTELTEDNTLLVGEDKEATFPSNAIAERRKHYQKAKVRKNTVFKPGCIYNFEIFAPFIDLNTFDLTLGINVNLLRYLRKQPIRLMAKSQSKNVYFFVIEFDLVKTSDSESDDLDLDTPPADTDVEKAPPANGTLPTDNSDVPPIELVQD